MGEFRARLIERIKRTQTVESFRFILNEKIDFLPGQFLKVIFDEDNKNNQGLNKYLSFSSSPYREYIEVTKRLSESEFSRKLNQLKIEDEFLFSGPWGNCIFREEYKKIGFLIGGIGITPVISILEYILDKKLTTDFILLYSNKSQDEIAFKEEMDKATLVHSNIKVIYTLTDYPPQDSSCIFGRINKELILDKVSDIPERLFFIFGPPKMVEAMKNLCWESGCKRENLKAESFIGY